MKLLVNFILFALAWSASAEELRPLKYITLPSKKPLTEVQISRLGNLLKEPAKEYSKAYRTFHEFAINIEDRYEKDKKYEKAVSAMSKFAKDRAWADFASLQASRYKQARESVFLGLNPYCQIVNGGLLYEPYLEHEKVEELRRQVQATLSDFGLSIPNVWRHARPVESEDGVGFDENLGLSPTQIRYREAQKRISGEIMSAGLKEKKYSTKGTYDPKKFAEAKKARKSSIQFGAIELDGIKREARENGEEWPEIEP